MTVTTAQRQVAERYEAHEDRVEFVDIPRRTYLALDGCERFGGQTFQNAIATLYPVAYALHFRLKAAGTTTPIGALEGLYWFRPDDGERVSAVRGDRDATLARWQLRLPVPEVATEGDVEAAIRDAARRRTLPALSRLHVVRGDARTCAQLLHVGPYASEAPSVARLREGISGAGFEPIGPQQEIYLNDPRQVGELKAKTILRLAVRAQRQRPRQEAPRQEAARQEAPRQERWHAWRRLA